MYVDNLQTSTLSYTNIVVRVLVSVVVVGIAFIAPVWFVVVCAVAHMAVFRAYEMVLIGLVLDALYGVALIEKHMQYTALFLCVYGIVYIVHTYVLVKHS